MDKQVLTIKQMQELIKVGIDISNASMCWIGCSDGNTVYPYDKTFRKCFEEHLDTIPLVLTPAFTLQDILQILSNIKGCTYTLDNTGIVIKDYDLNIIHNTNSNNPLKASFDMLKWCKENKYI